MPLSLCLACGELGGVDVVLNVLLFLPLGIGLAMSGASRSRAIISMCLASLSIELLQLGVIPGRDASLGDVLSNSLGGALGVLLGGHLHHFLWPGQKAGMRLAAAWSAVWLLGTALACYALVPLPTESAYYGQLARELGGKAAYPGRILSARFANASFPDREFSDPRSVARALRDGPDARAELVVVEHRSTRDLRAIARIADADQNEILLLGASDADLTFGVRTYASALRFRPIRFRMRSVLPDSTQANTIADTLRITAEYAPPAARMSVGGGRGEHGVEFPVTSAQSWRAIAPSQVDIDGSLSGAALDACWLFLVLLPLGYWTIAAAGTRHPFRPAALVILLVTLSAGFCEGPLLFGLAAPRWWEIAGAVASIVCGSSIALVVARRRPRPESRTA